MRWLASTRRDRGRCSARASAQEATDRGQKVRHRADRIHRRTACDRTPRGRVQGARWGGARSAERSGHLPSDRYRGFYRSTPPSGGQVRQPPRWRASPSPPRCATVGGKEVDIRADELFAVFKRPSGALAAALAIQRRAGSRSWPAGAKVRLRIGIHTGRPTLADGGYVGLPVHTAARICSAGHGGQILLSSDAVRAVEASAPRDVSFRSLGAHWLQGLPEPLPLFQLEAPDLPGNFPAPRTTKGSFQPFDEPTIGARDSNHVARTRSRSR